MGIFSKNKSALLKIFFTNPEQKFYIQEIGRILSKKPGEFQRELNNLEKEGILISEYSGNLRYFNVNKEYPLYDELKNIVFKTIGIIGSLREIILKIGKVKFCFIYGSYAKSQENFLSDIDIFFIGDIDENLLVNYLEKTEKSLKRDINYKLLKFTDFKKEIISNNAFVLNILKDKKIMIAGSENELGRLTEKQSNKKS